MATSISVSLVLRVTAAVRIVTSKRVIGNTRPGVAPDDPRLLSENAVNGDCVRPAFYQVIFAFATAAIALGWVLS
jgi:hypothetical protein